MIFAALMLQATELTPSTDAQRAAYDRYERCITVQGTLLEPSDADLPDLLLAAKARCASDAESLSRAVDEYALANAAATPNQAPLVSSAQMFGFLEQRALDAAKPSIITARAARRGR